MTPTSTRFSLLDWQVESNVDLDEVALVPPLPIFDPQVLAFLDQLSKRLMAGPAIRQFPDLASFAFACRGRNLSRIRKHYEGRGQLAFGRGVTLHFTPSNVPLNFAYSLYAGLLAGNVCLIRMSSREFEQARVLNEAIEGLLRDPAFEEVSRRIGIFRYDRDPEMTRQLSSLCDVRVIWGSDETIDTIREAPISARAYDITFADRYSIAVIHASSFLALEDKGGIARGFYNDTLFFDQNACTSPRLVYWVGEADVVAEAQSAFWREFEAVCDEKRYENHGNMAVEKLLRQFMSAIELDGSSKTRTDELIQRVELSAIPENLERFTAPGGFFLEVVAPDLALLRGMRERKLQTLTYVGYEPSELVRDLNGGAMLGLERVVPYGRASEFSLLWDGYDLIGQMSKCLSVS